MANDSLHLGAKLLEAKLVCVFVHGRGQSPEAMQAHVINRLAAPNVAYVLPRAPMGQWYAARAVDRLTMATRSELTGSLEQLNRIVTSVPQNTPMLLAGFSQGACLVIEYAMKYGPWNGALASFTGCRVGVESDERPISDLEGMPVYLTGADADPWIPSWAYGQAAENLSRARARLRSDVFPGRPHDVSDDEIAVFNEMLISLANKQIPWRLNP
jgi:phospholipase/carboxylesterase